MSREYTFQHLILLVGTNPLPNFVVAEYFLQNNSNLQTIWLIHSEENKSRNQKGTEGLAKNLEALFKDRNITIKLIPISDISRAKEIESAVRTKCLEKLAPTSSIHFNYTGGTKVMGLHTYRTIEQYSRLNSKSFSYLDAKTFQIIDDEQGAMTEDLRQKIKLPFDQLDKLVELHGYTHKKGTDPNFDEAIKIFTTIANTGALAAYFDDEIKVISDDNLIIGSDISELKTHFESEKGGFNRVLFEVVEKQIGKSPNLISKKKQLEAKLPQLKEYRPKGAFLSVLEALPEGFRIFQNHAFTVTDLKNNDPCEQSIKFLAGEWLDNYVFDVLRRRLTAKDVYKNWVIKKATWSKDFQLDVILLKGYQLLGISCTTDSTPRLCKSKGFEIIHRSEQIGGDEAKAILITCLTENARYELEQELQIDTGGSEKFLVLGTNDLEEHILVEKVQKFMKN